MLDDWHGRLLVVYGGCLMYAIWCTLPGGTPAQPMHAATTSVGSTTVVVLVQYIKLYQARNRVVPDFPPKID